MNDDQSQLDTSAEQEPAQDELALLKQRATMMGIPFSNNISVATLKAKIQAKMDEAESAAAPAETAAPVAEKLNPLAGDKAGETPAAKKTERQIQLEEQMKLVRCRITCMNPAKKDLGGEIWTVANEVIGTVKKFVAYGEASEEGYHIPYILYQMLEGKKFQHIRTFKDKRTGHQKVVQTQAKEFSIEVLPQLTEVELNRLAMQQAASGALTND